MVFNLGTTIPKPLRVLSFVLCAIGLIAWTSSTAGANAKYASIIVDAETGRTLQATNADSRKYPASLTKIMTLYMVFDALERGKLKMNQRLKVSRRASRQPPSKLGLRAGSTIRVKDAILALITKSANDVAATIAENLGGTEFNFSQEMTRKARELGMTRTTFRNASGLPNRRQMSTARDMAKLAIAIRQDFPQYYKYFKTKTFKYNGRRFGNHNKLLRQYQGTDGIKTGYIRAAGFNLVASVERNGHRLIGVVFGGKTGKRRDRQMMKLLNTSFKKMRRLQIASKTPPLPELRPTKEQLLAAAAKPEPKKQEEPSAQQLAQWGVQVGAYSKENAARQSITSARKKLPKLLSHTHDRIDRLHRKNGPVFRARLVGLSEGDARRACVALKKRKLPCIPVPGQDGVDLAMVEDKPAKSDQKNF